MDTKNETNIPACCRKIEKPENRKGAFWGIVYGILPHSFCVAFIALSVVGATAGAAFFGKCLALPFFFPLLIALSLVFATISAALYLRRNGGLSLKGAKRNRKYLGILYGSTLGIGLIFAYAIFPLVIGATNPAAAALQTQNFPLLSIKVAIPCPGHAALIIGELDKVSGVKNVEFVSPDIFKISYDAAETSPQTISEIDIFKTYKATSL
jgi:hypothetical protein